MSSNKKQTRSKSPKKEKAVDAPAPFDGRQEVTEGPEPTMCTQCLGLVAYFHCMSCLDNFCSSCWSGIHKGGALARHERYVIQQPEGYIPDTEILVRHPRPQETAANHKSDGTNLVMRNYMSQAAEKVDVVDTDVLWKNLDSLESKLSDSDAGTASERKSWESECTFLRGLIEVETKKKSSEVYKHKKMEELLTGGSESEKVTLNDISRYLARRRGQTASGNQGSYGENRLGPSFGMHIYLQPRESVIAAAREMITVENASAVGGLDVFKYMKPDGWLTGVVVKGGSVKKFI